MFKYSRAYENIWKRFESNRLCKLLYTIVVMIYSILHLHCFNFFSNFQYDYFCAAFIFNLILFNSFFQLNNINIKYDDKNTFAQCTSGGDGFQLLYCASLSFVVPDLLSYFCKVHFVWICSCLTKKILRGNAILLARTNDTLVLLWK